MSDSVLTLNQVGVQSKGVREFKEKLLNREKELGNIFWFVLSRISLLAKKSVGTRIQNICCALRYGTEPAPSLKTCRFPVFLPIDRTAQTAEKENPCGHMPEENKVLQDF